MAGDGTFGGAPDVLVAAKILEGHVRRGQRYYQAPEVLDPVTLAERRPASTKFDTPTSPPVRPVPAPQAAGAIASSAVSPTTVLTVPDERAGASS